MRHAPLGRLAGVLAVLAVPVLAGPGTVDASDRVSDHGGVPLYPEGSAVGRGLTPAEKRFLETHPLRVPLDTSTPPTGPVHCVAEYEPMEGLLLAWEGLQSWMVILDQIAANVTTIGDADVYAVVDSASEQTSVYNRLVAAGADMARVHFVVRTTDTIWIRDYGPRYIYEGGCRAIVDHTYNRPRPNDNAFPSHFSAVKRHAYYQIPLIHGGGNYHLNALDESNTSRLINNENPTLTEAEIHDLWLTFQNVDTTFFDPLPPHVDATQHIDMWMQVVDDGVIVISDWPNDPGSIQDQICEAATTLMTGRGYTVHRVPARSVSGTHYTYTNVVVCNDLVLVPTYTNPQVTPHNAEALAAWTQAAGGRTVVPIDCESIVSYAGVMHCIVMHVPVPVGGENPTVYMRNGRGGEVLEPGTFLETQWISDDDEQVTTVDILLSTNGGASFDTVIAEGLPDSGTHYWEVPNIFTTAARLRLVVHDAAGNTGSDESDANLTINGTPIPGDVNGDGVVNVLDLLAVLAAWGPCPGCPEDINGDGRVDVLDLLEVLSHWG